MTESRTGRVPSGTATGGEGRLETRIAALAKVDEVDVRDVFTTYGLPLVLTPARPRELRLLRLRLVGTRTGSASPGPFDSTLHFNTGLTALVASNFRGKTSVLELITWCLRGTPRDELLSGVKRWLRHLDLDIVVAGQPLGFRLDITDGTIVAASVLTSPTEAALVDARERNPVHQVTVVFQAGDEDSYAEQVAGLMMDRLDLSPVVNAFKETGTQTHGWPTYFGAVYLGAASTKVLLGDHPTGGLPGRLLQVFLDLPAAAALTRVKTAHEIRANQIRNREAHQEQAVAERATERRHTEAQLEAARARLAELTAAVEHGESLSDLARGAARLAREVADAQVADDNAQRAARHTKAERQQAAKRLSDVRESDVARALFQGLDPEACPRCDQAISTDRKQREHNSHACAVCDRPVVTDGVSSDDVIAEAEERLSAATEAEDEAQADAASTRSHLKTQTADLEAVEHRLRRAQTAASLPDLLEAQQQVWRLEGSLAVLPEISTADNDDSEAITLSVLKAAANILEEDNKHAASALFADLNNEIVDIARRFGMGSLESVHIDRSARLRVTQDGGGQDWFKRCSSGARLRLRIALVVALLRVGAAHGVSTHPGLIMIDSPKAEEVQDLDATNLFRELAAIAEEQGSQVLITTRDYDLVHEVLDEKHTIEVAEGEPLW
ncbi:hypothetical protein [Nocardia nova]|uniref:hypothetical protein n=1 Tax=Nocardia nova TaxID=37330 RepID=UPI0033C37DC7